MTTLTRALNSIGKKCFIDYYDQFQSCTDTQDLANTLLHDNPHASSLSAQLTRINYAKWIFENNLENEALDLILHSARLDPQTIETAKRLLSKNAER